MLNLIFEKGEIRRFEFTARSQKPHDTVVVTSAKWSLVNLETEQEEASGIGDIIQNTISVLVPFNVPGKHMLEVTAVIPPETIKERIELKVKL